MSYLLDADWVINALAGKRNAQVILDRLAPHGIAISRITFGEIYEGAFASPYPHEHLAILREFLSPFRALDVTDQIMERFAQIRTQLRRRGELIPDFDLVLAATALCHDLTVLTFNIRHFARMPELSLYQQI